MRVRQEGRNREILIFLSSLMWGIGDMVGVTRVVQHLRANVRGMLSPEFLGQSDYMPVRALGVGGCPGA